MKYILPQEIQVWYILPVIRRELSRIIVKEKGFSQKKTAKMLSLTEGAVSQYLNAKRGNNVKFSESILKEIEKSADTIIKDNSRILEETIRLLNLKDIRELVCSFHKDADGNIDKKCDICDKYECGSKVPK